MTARRWILAALCAIALAFTSSGEEPSTYGQTREGVIGAVTAAAADGRTLSGQQVNEYEVFIACTSFERIHELTGAWPAILGLELMFIIENPSYREHFMRRAREHAARGGIVTLTWHARNPIRVCPRGEYYKCASMPMSEDELARLLDPSTQEHRLWAADVDAVADVLAELTALGIAPIFRPYHEMNGHWFWWGQKEAYRELWRALHARLAGEHGLDQLVWAWSPDKESAGAEAYYPGEDSVDFLGADLYAARRDADMYATARANVAPLHGSGLFAFTEIGLLPTVEIFQDLAPSWFLLWGGEFINKDWSPEPCPKCNAAEDVAAIYALDSVVTLDELTWPEGAEARFDAAARSAPPSHACPASLL